MERRGWIDPARTPTRHPPPADPHVPARRQEQFEAWAHESLFTALACEDTLIALRPYVQAVEYLTRLRHEVRIPVGALGDLLAVARSRIEVS